MAESAPSLHCFICNNRAGVSIRNAVPIFNEQITISSNPLPETISSILDCNLSEKEVHSSIICKKCYKLCEEYNEAQLRLSEIRNTLKDQFQKTLLIHNLDINTAYKKLNSIDLTADLDDGNAKQKEQLVTDSNGLKDQSKNLSLPLPGAKISPLPPNVLIVHKGKKLAIQKTDGKVSSVAEIIPDVVMSVKKTLPTSDSSKQKNKTNKVNQVKPQKFFAKVDSVPQTESPFSEKTCILENLVQELPEGDTKEISTEINCENEMTVTDIPNADLECLEGSEELRSALSDVKIKNKKVGSKFIISEVEIMEDAEENLEVEEGTILMGQDENGEIIRVLRSAGGRLVRDGHGNVLYRGNSEISLVLPGQDGDIENNKDEEDDEIEYTTESLKMECQDSNDGSHIELQMSGDEETAKAIMAAAAERNTYIKLESESGFPGMFRVRTLGGVSGESEEEDVDSPGKDASVVGYDGVDSIVQRNGSLYSCVLCLNAEKQNEAQEEILPKANIFKSEDSSTPEELLQNGAAENQTVNQTELKSAILGDAKSIMQHIRVAHNARVYICVLCGDVMRKRIDLTRHMDEHHASDDLNEDGKLGKKQTRHATSARPHACHICFRKYSSRNLLEEHMNVHNGIRPYSCEVCGKSFASKYTHQAHMKTHTNRPRPHACQQCPKAFFTLQNLAQHEKTHSGIKNFFCKVCGKAFGTQHNLEVHGVVHSGFKPFVCRTCGKAFARRAEIRDHERTHTGERPFSCDICGATFSQRSNLQSHKRATHLDDKRHGCPHCDKRFKRRRLLEYHIKASHTGERPYKCDICGATFVYPEHFKKHRRIHSGEKPYVCEVCGKSFNSRDNRNAHRFVHSDKKPYECLVCGTGFMRKPLLYAHMNTQGHLTDTIVVNQPRLAMESSASDGPIGPHILDDGSTIEERIEEIDSSLKDKNVITTTSIGENQVPACAKMLIAGEHRIIIHDNQQIYTTQVVGENSQQRQLIFTTEGDHMSKSTLSLVPGSVEEGGVLTLSGNIITKTETAELMGGVPGSDDAETLLKGEPGELTADHIEIVTNEEGHVITTDEDGSMIRLVQIQLPDGENGWVALDS